MKQILPLIKLRILIKQFIITLTSVLHASVMVLSGQVTPVCDVQVLVLVRTPPRQVLEQALHVDHTVEQEQPPHCTNILSKVYQRLL